MHPISTTLAGLALLSSSAFVAELKVNYYSDGGCSDTTRSNSANIADCTFHNGVCSCTFYTQTG
ncbi:hypothetical protein GE09DRAFT_1224701 [Coniochaeta sp. 2T2.1]|nr:hypothetical protein GE09DRAFT_1224701 [Coniochaeta sp. 2T2.1]